MRRGVILLSMVLSMAIAVAQDFYTIQVRSLSRETPLTMEELQAGMWQHKVGGQTKCFMGRFDTYEEAKAALVPLKVGKYSGAFVVSSDKIFGSNAPESMPDQTLPPTQSTVPASTESSTTPATPAAKIKTYTIQIAAYRYPLYTKEFNLEDEVMEFYCSDNIYRYTVGAFEEENKAREKLKQIKASGYPDAFLIDYKKYEVYRIE